MSFEGSLGLRGQLEDDVKSILGVEVFKGAAATRYGPNTVGGAINMLTRPIPERRGGELDFAYGLRKSWKLHGWGGYRCSTSPLS